MRPRVVVADPPWDFETYSNKAQRSAKSHYDTMSMDDIAGLGRWLRPVIPADSILLLWATWPHLKDCIRVGEAWGYAYKTLAFDWVKVRERGAIHAGMGYYTMANSEPCLLFTRGAVGRDWILDNGVMQIIFEDERQQVLPGFGEALIAELKGHSTKPSQFYSRVKRLLAGPFLELFARRDQGAGWTCLGNAMTGRDIRDDLTTLAIDLMEFDTRCAIMIGEGNADLPMVNTFVTP